MGPNSEPERRFGALGVCAAESHGSGGFQHPARQAIPRDPAGFNQIGDPIVDPQARHGPRGSRTR